MNNLQLDRIERKMDIILGTLPKPKKTWITARAVNNETGWTAEKLRQHRESGLITSQKVPGKKHSFRYLRESIPADYLLKNQTV